MLISKVCTKCDKNKLSVDFHKGRMPCKNCVNTIRRENQKKSICRYCKIEFRPGVKGRYKFCSEKCRFLDKVKIGKEDECWIWQGGHYGRGYGHFRNEKGFKEGAHRVSYRLFKGSLLKDKLILHDCDFPSCVNPGHLRIGTHLDNMQDMIKRGRNKNGTPGENNPKAKLKDADIIIIRSLCKSGIKRKEIADKYGLTADHVSEIYTRKLWKHIE